MTEINLARNFNIPAFEMVVALFEEVLLSKPFREYYSSLKLIDQGF